MPFPPYPNMMPYMENEDYQDSVDSDDMWSEAWPEASEEPTAAKPPEAAKEPEAAGVHEAAEEPDAANEAEESEADDVQYVSGPTTPKLFFPKKVNVEKGIKFVVIYALGMENLPGVKFWHNWDKRLTTSIAKVFSRQYNVVHPADLFVDARMFHEDRCPGRHCGEHASFIRSIVDSSGFDTWLAEFKGHFEDENASYSTPERAYVIATCCKAGIHRSVAAAAILQSIVKNLGIHCEVVWLSKSDMEARKFALDLEVVRTGALHAPGSHAHHILSALLLMTLFASTWTFDESKSKPSGIWDKRDSIAEKKHDSGIKAIRNPMDLVRSPATRRSWTQDPRGLETHGP